MRAALGDWIRPWVNEEGVLVRGSPSWQDQPPPWWDPSLADFGRHPGAGMAAGAGWAGGWRGWGCGSWIRLLSPTRAQSGFCMFLKQSREQQAVAVARPLAARSSPPSQQDPAIGGDLSAPPAACPCLARGGVGTWTG